MKLLAGAVIGLAYGFVQIPGAHEKVGPLKHGPLDYFQRHCSRCHGVDGGAYEDGFTKDKTPSELRDTILQMSEGQGGSPLTDSAELAAQVAYHFAMDRKDPFIDWTGQDGSELTGEVTPDTSLTALVKGQTVPVHVKERTWRLELPSGASAVDVKLTGKQKDRSESLDLSRGAFLPLAPLVTK